METNLDRLHLVHETFDIFGSFPRRIGKTYYSCHLVAGYLELLKNETILVYINKLDMVNNFIKVLVGVLKEHYLEIDRIDNASFRIYMKYNGNCIKIMAPRSTSLMHPIDTGANYNLYPILDMNNKSGTWWSKSKFIPLGEFEKLDKI